MILNVSLNEESYQRLLPLREKNFVSTEALDQARTAKRAADATLAAALLDAQSFSAGVSGVDALEAQCNGLIIPDTLLEI